MRKFRGKTKTTEGEKWIYGFCYEVKSFFDNSKQTYIRREHILDTVVISKTIGQSTGLKDKNGIEIYEGDIVRLYGDKEYIGIIKYDLASFRIYINKISEYLGSVNVEGQFLEVIGNIYDNKELLEEK